VTGSRRTRREFLFLAAGWFPFFWRRRSISLAGAKFRILRRSRSGRRYLVIHGNEETARQVLEEHMQTHAGVAYLITSRERNVPVDGGIIDPNRMFSRIGAEASLKRLNPQWTAEQIGDALRALDRGREKLVRALVPRSGARLVALHNNSEGYSVKDEVPVSDEVSLKEPGEPHAFFLCTDPKDFAVLSTSPYNVVLKHRKPVDDDGSLSRLAARRGIRYINLEVGLGGFDRQRGMLLWLERHLP
jgi:hypothetical protein